MLQTILPDRGALLRIVLLATLLAATIRPIATAQAWPEARHNPAIPTLAETVGHDYGEAVSSVAELADYLRALEAAAPDRMDVMSYGETWQGRELLYAVISSPGNMARLEEIRANTARLASGEQIAEAERSRLINETPAVVWLSYGVHGDEISPPESALYVAWHLLAAQDDALVDSALENLVIIIDPSQNPDGRDRFVHSFESALGLEPLADRHTAEHDQPWPRGRFNHYLFDLNRDWFAMTQPETQGKVAAVRAWNPVVYVDAHEMGGDTTYYFPPPAQPYNPHITQDQNDKQVQMGRNHAGWFDRFEVPYFTREVFDAFYPGYGDMWPTLNGAIAMTFEQASARGLRFARRDGEELTYKEGVRNNVLASLSTLQVVANNREDYLGDYAAYRASAVSEARASSTRYVVMDLSERRYEAEALARRLSGQGIDVQRIASSSSQCGRAYPAGALIVDLAQPEGRLARTLLSPTTDLAEDFIAVQEDRRARGLDHQLYDVTAWSLPLMDGVSAELCARVSLQNASLVDASEPISSIINGDASFGYAVPWSDGGQARLVIAALRAGLVGRSTSEPFTQNGRVFPSGTVVFAGNGNEEDFREELRRLAREVGGELVGMPTSWVEDGPNLGSSAFARLVVPRVAIAWGEGTNPTSAGNTRFVLERQLGLPVSPIRLSNLGSADLSLYDVLIVPDLYGNLDATEAVKTFVSNGGVLVGFESALQSFTSEEAELLSTALEYAASEEEEANGEGEGSRVPGLLFANRGDYEAYVADHDHGPEDVPGVIARAVANRDHWLAAGYVDANVLVTGSSIYRPLRQGDGQNVFSFAGPDELLLSGYLWEENRAQLAYKPFVMAESHGEGLVIGFTQSPTTRAYLNGLNLLLANAVVLGPARVRG